MEQQPHAQQQQPQPQGKAPANPAAKTTPMRKKASRKNGPDRGAARQSPSPRPRTKQKRNGAASSSSNSGGAGGANTNTNANAGTQDVYGDLFSLGPAGAGSFDEGPMLYFGDVGGNTLGSDPDNWDIPTISSDRPGPSAAATGAHQPRCSTPISGSHPSGGVAMAPGPSPSPYDYGRASPDASMYTPLGGGYGGGGGMHRHHASSYGMHQGMNPAAAAPGYHQGGVGPPPLEYNPYTGAYHHPGAGGGALHPGHPHSHSHPQLAHLGSHPSHPAAMGSHMGNQQMALSHHPGHPHSISGGHTMHYHPHAAAHGMHHHHQHAPAGLHPSYMGAAQPSSAVGPGAAGQHMSQQQYGAAALPNAGMAMMGAGAGGDANGGGVKMEHVLQLVSQLKKTVNQLDANTKRTISDSLLRLANTKENGGIEMGPTSSGGEKDHEMAQKLLDRSVCQLLFQKYR
mmetsp:Transcript_11613/g.30016  ORF Transcript_11613/g.30016 Transcript_11613/m.30016 type:complete len:456 (-) Transcript_11613:1381-2748(-)|eukprot:CAMPEP_0197490258 /NCGR_PEP_ID=MMETSP1311-20131121/4843_1 /TAXON_ID=464262 /ORGANISM="Genus nov. species nov., Strain RCC856" /LENGTH=455 /DNA_ID=CAMNT_0043034743 /DNA_START=294 /DNA_END=1661 /DNA_ORIENTATION=-